MKQKSINLFIAALFLSLSTFAQTEQDNNNSGEDQIEYRTLFKENNKAVTHGGYGAFSMGYTEIDNKSALQFGGRGAWIINQRFALGFGGNGFFNNLNKPNPVTEADYYVSGGYGGLLLQPIVYPNHPVHLSFPILIGGGGVSTFSSKNLEKYNWDHYHNSNYSYFNDSDYFFVFEPGIDVEFNILKFFRIAVGASYRFASDVNLKYTYTDEITRERMEINLDQNLMNNYSLNISFLFGWF